jgi:hypothetical protein
MPVSKIEVIENCKLELDISRGVLYITNKDTGANVLRICGLRKDIEPGSLLLGNPLDITIRGKSVWVQYPTSEADFVGSLPAILQEIP